MTTFSRFLVLAALAAIVTGCGGPVEPEGDAGRTELDAEVDGAAPVDAAVPDAACPTDVDGDGHQTLLCDGDDCDDDDASRFGGNVEVCNDVDEDCDSTTYGERDLDSDGYDDAACCNPTATGETCGGDCDDTQPGVHPEAPEVCNGRDDDCDLAIDEGVLTTFHADCDGDGFGGAEMITQCTAPAAPPTTCPGALWIGVGGDCDDARSGAHPTALETCNTMDDDCDGTVDDGGSEWCATSLPNAASAACSAAGACSVVACAAPYLDCSPAPGCEIDGSNDGENCAACGVGCAFGCRASTCDDAVEVQGGRRHTCVRRESGTVVCFGENTWGQLGDGTTVSRSRAAPVPGITAVAEISAGSNHTCVRHTGGTVSCWGDNTRGQLGGGTLGTSSATPIVVTGLSDAVEIAAGDIRSCARHASGAVSCWGAQGAGRGDATGGDRTTPGMVTGVANAIAISVGANHACAVRSTRAVACWGANSQGQLGNGTLTASSAPGTVTGITTAIDVIAGDDFSCALLSSGDARCWGLNAREQLGDGTTTRRTTPVAVSGIWGAVELATAPESFSEGHVCARNTEGDVRCWGANSNGQLGTGSTGLSDGVGVMAALGVDDIGVGGVHSCAIYNGSVSCWGGNAFGALGDGTVINRVRAEEVLAP